MRLCGPALPVQCAPGDNGWIHRALYVAEAPGSVLVVTVGEGREAGYWGAVLTEAAIARGVRGLVIDGCVRDADEIAALGFPVFAAGVSILGTTKDPAAPGSIGAPIQLGRSRVASGDVIVGDGDGLVVIERERAEAVFDRAVERDDRERGYIAALRSGATTIDLFAIEAPAPPGRADPWLDRLDRVEQRLLAHAHAALPSGLTPPDTATGEQWDAGQVWAHLAEFGQYWLDELQLVLDAPGDAPPAFGRVKSNAARVAAIAAGRHRTSAEQVVVMQDAIDRLRRMLQGMAPADWDRVGRHQTLGDLDVDAQLQHFHVGHYEEHADQLDGLTAP
jgi:4-hydroxy-4-methyl-2-oxoglutarate aldolase